MDARVKAERGGRHGPGRASQRRSHQVLAIRHFSDKLEQLKTDWSESDRIEGSVAGRGHQSAYLPALKIMNSML